MLKKILKPFSSYYRLIKKFKNHTLVKALIPFPYTPKFHQLTKLENKDNNILISPYNFSLNKNKLSLFQGAHGMLEKFIKSSKITFNDDLLQVQEGENTITLNVHSADNLVAINEIYIEEIYNYVPPKNESYVVLDIGMNIGTASLYFASKPWVEKVIAYEPFTSTYADGSKNIALNPILGNKIAAHKYGISDSTKVVSGTISESGSLGGVTAEIENAQINPDEETVQLKDIAEEFEQLLSDYPSSNFIFKIDCEGEEYAILNRLAETNLIQKIDAFMLEYHFKGKESLVNTLHENGFTSFSPYADFEEFGMIYAFRT